MTISYICCEDTLTDAQSQEEFDTTFRDHGVVVMTDIISSQEIEFLKTEATHFSQNREDGEKPFAPYHHIHEVEQEFGQIVRNKRLVEAADILAGGPVDLVQSLFYFKPPGYLGFNRHQDNHFVRAEPARSFVIAWLAIDDADEENGCLYVYPGSHMLPILSVHENDPKRGSTQSRTVHEHYGEIDISTDFPCVPLLIRSGSIAFMHANLVHGSGKNESKDRFRHALSLDYIAAAATFRPGYSAKRTRTNVHDDIIR